MVHDQMVPRQLLFRIKTSLAAGTRLEHATVVSADALSCRVVDIQRNTSLTPNQRFRFLNDVLVEANFLPTKSAKYEVFTAAIASKVSALNDGISPVRPTLRSMLDSMNARRRWAQLLAAHAFWYAEQINNTWLALYFIHSRAVGFNARNEFSRAVTEFQKGLRYLENMRVSSARQAEVVETRARLVREMAVCRAKITQNSRLAVNEATSSLDMARATGKYEGIVDGLNRCVETFLYEGELSKAESYLDKLLSSRLLVPDHSWAIAKKMQAKLLIAQGEITKAEETVQDGLNFSLSHQFHHQVYHFKRLQWNLKNPQLDRRERIIT
jgi:hypothetical protein